MHSRHPRKGRTWWTLLSLVALWFITSATKAVAAVEMYQGTPVGFTADGQPFRGNPDAPLTLVEYSDYLCPFCEAYFSRALPALVEKYVRTGQVKFVLHDF